MSLKEIPKAQKTVTPKKEVIWYWQSNADPWSTNSTTETWEEYSEDQTIAIQKAWQTSKETVDLGVYYINFESMLQIHKMDNSRVRRIKRVENIQSRCVASVPKAKTINEPIGSLVEFLAYIQHSCCSYNPIINEWILGILENRPTRIPTYELKILVEDIIDGIINAGKKKNQERRSQELIGDLSKISMIDYDFDAESISLNYGCGQAILSEKKKDEESYYKMMIIRAALGIYSEESFVFTSMNESLRLGLWEKLEDLRAFCVLLTLALLGQEQQHAFTGKVYRGVNLARELLEYYAPLKTRYFSWHSFISTSKKRECAEKFVYESPDFAPVIFEIQLENNIAVDVSKYSKFPEEEEKLLLPGSVYEIIDKKVQNNRVIISLKMVSHAELLQATEHNKKFLEQFKNHTFTEETLVFDARAGVRGKQLQFNSRKFPLSREGVQKISTFIKDSFCITKIELSHSNIDDNGAEILSKALLSMRVKWLSLTGNRIGDRGAVAIAKVIEQTSLLEIYLKHNLIKKPGAHAIANAIVNRPPFNESRNRSSYSYSEDCRPDNNRGRRGKEPVFELGIEYNEIGDLSLREILFCFKHMQIRALYLNEIGLTDEGVKWLSILIEDQPHIKSIHLCHNKFGDRGAVFLVENLSLTLDSLFFTGNMISERGVNKIIERLPNLAIKSIALPGSETRPVPEITNLNGETIYISFHEMVQ